MDKKRLLSEITVLVVLLMIGVTTVLLPSASAAPGAASDWPTWRYDLNRSASSPEGLPAELHVQWVHQYTPRERVWNDPLNWDMMRYDKNFEPIVLGDTMFLGFSDSDKIVALDTDTGEEKWRFYTDGPVRLPPAVWNEKLYATSDDGYLYCLDTGTGDLKWKFQGALYERKVLGNKRLISAWPARGGVVIEDERVYFAASIFPLMGTFIYCLDAETGDVIWLNDGEGARWTNLPHNRAEGFGGIAPQGALTISGDRLLVSGGRSVPACFDKNTGEYLYYRVGDYGKTGGDFVAATEDVFFNHHAEKICHMYATSTGDVLVGGIGRYPVIDGNSIYTSSEGTVAAYDVTGIVELMKKELESEELEKQAKTLWENPLWSISVDASGDLIKAGNRLYASGDNTITAIDISEGVPSIAWVMPLNGVVERLVAANGKLFAVTLDGRIMAFGEKDVEPNYILDISAPAAVSTGSTEEALSIIEKTGVSEGYALFYGSMGNGELLEALVCNSELNFIAVDEDEVRVEEMRRRFDEVGLYGKRISVLQGDPLTIKAPPYMTSLIIMNVDSPVTFEILEVLYDSMRPYGGKLLFMNRQSNLSSLVENSNLSKLEIIDEDLISRDGALTGSAPFTHNAADIANTGKTNDELVKPPLGVLWFGGELSNVDILPRHGHGPPPQVIGGLLFIEGEDKLSCVDVYTGRLVWQRRFDDMETYGIYFDETYKDAPTVKRYNQEHLPGANIRGTNYIATEDKVYIINAHATSKYGWKVDVIDAATGKMLETIELPKIAYIKYNGKETLMPQQWGYIGVYKDLLIGSGELVAYSDLIKLNKSETSPWYPWENFDFSAGKRLYVMDRHSGEVKWSYNSTYGLLHNGIVAGEVGGREMLFVLDKLQPGVEDQLERRGKEIPTGYRLLALDINTGEIIWEKTDETDAIFGSYLALSEEYGILLQSTRASRDTVKGEEGTRMIARDASNGIVLWDETNEYRAFPILHHETIICGAEEWKSYKLAKHFSLLTGEPLTRESPITDSEVNLTWARGYGCNHPLASEHMVLFRSGAAGYFDLNQNSGTGNFGGFKSGCSESLIAADGVLSSPDYTRTCICAYQNQLSLALVNMPENEAWTFNELKLDDTAIKRIGLNLGAPGDHVAKNGTWWFDYPSVGHPSEGSSDHPETLVIPVEITGEAEYFVHHSSRFEGELPWVAASGCEGLSNLVLSNTTGSYTVRLYFAEPDDVAVGERVFDVAIQGVPVLTNFDVVQEAGKPRKTVVKEFNGLLADGDGQLVIAFDASGAKQIINGIEVISEGISQLGSQSEIEMISDLQNTSKGF
ncbi:MAG: PQQ-binding-like beta-propeller repeat protein [Euryarchaeota archaeon]|nr:PQQ-binding-like beta-propeller repeat protein [Euryarchaeota archaeon]